MTSSILLRNHSLKYIRNLAWWRYMWHHAIPYCAMKMFQYTLSRPFVAIWRNIRLDWVVPWRLPVANPLPEPIVSWTPRHKPQRKPIQNIITNTLLIEWQRQGEAYIVECTWSPLDQLMACHFYVGHYLCQCWFIAIRPWRTAFSEFVSKYNAII